METKSFKINIPEGFEIDREKSTFEEVIFKPIPKKGLPKSWDDLKIIKGFYVDNNAEVDSVNCLDFPYAKRGLFKNVFPTKEEAEASVALAQLCQLRDVYNEGWKPDWGDNTSKHCIIYTENKFRTITYATYVHFLSFKKEEIAKKFIENFRDLLEKAKPLL